jgi:hypothetical protein
MGEREACDMITETPMVCDAGAINAFLPEGLRVLEIRTANRKPDSLNAAIVAARYRFSPLDEAAIPAIRRAGETLNAETTARVATRGSNGPVQRDVRPLIYKIEMTFDSAGTFGIDATLSMLPAKTCRPAEFLSALFPAKELCGFLVRRTACLVRNGGGLLPVE